MHNIVVPCGLSRVSNLPNWNLGSSMTESAVDSVVNDDPWQLPERWANRQDLPKDYLRMEEINGVVPLDLQIGVWPKKSVPHALMASLFGGPKSHDSEALPKDGHLQLYAILDAAKIRNLPMLLESSGLEHCCLYKGGALAQLSDVAPWLVRLEESSNFTRNLFTQGDAPWHLWGKDAGILIQSVEPIDELARHFRRFTRPRDEAGHTLFFRFWDPRILGRYLRKHHSAAKQHMLLLLSNLRFIIINRRSHTAALFCASESIDSPKLQKIGNWPHLKTDLSAIQFEIFKEDLTDRMSKRYPSLAAVAENDRLALLGAVVHDAVQLNLRGKLSIERFCEVSLMLGHSPADDVRFFDFFTSSQHELDRTRKMHKRAKEILMR